MSPWVGRVFSGRGLEGGGKSASKHGFLFGGFFGSASPKEAFVEIITGTKNN
jgi:hypothetical protein